MSEKRMDMHVNVRCPDCSTVYNVICNQEDYVDWRNGKLIQQAMPYLNATDRELLITGMCDDCWNLLTRPNEDYLLDDDYENY